MIWRTTGFLIFLAIGGCATTDSVRMSHLAGAWYGSAHQSHLGPYLLHWVNDRSEDGTFSIVFYEERGCGLSEVSREEGRWSMGNGIYTTVTTRVDGRAVNTADPFYQDVYEVLGASRNTLRYRSISHGIEFEAERVKPGYRPPLPMCSNGLST